MVVELIKEAATRVRPHLTDSLRNCSHLHLAKDTLNGVRNRYLKKWAWDDYFQLLPENFKQLSQNLFCCSSPTTTDELKTMIDYFNVDVILCLNMCPINPYMVYNIERARNLPGSYCAKYKDVEIDLNSHFVDSGQQIRDKITIINVPIPHGSIPTYKQIKQIQETYRKFKEKNICLCSYYGSSRCYVLAAIYYDLFECVGKNVIRQRIQKFQESDTSEFSLDQSLYVYYNSMFPIASKEEKSGICSPEIIMKRQVNLVRMMYEENFCGKNGTRLERVFNEFKLMKVDSGNGKHRRFLLVKPLTSMEFSLYQLKYLLWIVPKFIVTDMLGSYESLYEEINYFRCSLSKSDKFRNDYFHYFKVLFDVRFPELCRPRKRMEDKLKGIMLKSKEEFGLNCCLMMFPNNERTEWKKTIMKRGVDASSMGSTDNKKFAVPTGRRAFSEVKRKPPKFVLKMKTSHQMKRKVDVVSPMDNKKLVHPTRSRRRAFSEVKRKPPKFVLKKMKTSHLMDCKFVQRPIVQRRHSEKKLGKSMKPLIWKMETFNKMTSLDF